MRKLLFPAAILSVITLASCSNEIDLPAGNDGMVTFRATLSDPAMTRAYGDGDVAKTLSYAVYEHGQIDPVFASDVTGSPAAIAESNKQFSLSLPLLKGKSYDIIFWADASENDIYTFSSADQSVSVKYGEISTAGNDENRDAFFQRIENLEVTGSTTHNVQLRRPFAQLNVATDDLDLAESAKAGLVKVETTVSGIHNTLNLLSGEASGEATVTFTTDFVKGDKLTIGEGDKAKEYDHLAMNYILTGVEEDPATPGDVHHSQKELLNCTVKFLRAGDEVINTLDLPNIPVQRNYRTNIFGTLLTSSHIFNIVVEPDFWTPDHVMEVVAKSADDVVSALASPFVKKIAINSDIDMSGTTQEELTFSSDKVIEVAKGATLNIGEGAHFETTAGLTLSGGGKISNVSTTRASDVPLGPGYYKSLIHIYGGELVLDGVTLENDPSYHYHGDASAGRPYNSAAISYWNDTKITIKNSRIISGEFTLCGMQRGGSNQAVIVLENSYFESTSSSQNGTGNYSYAMRLFGKTATLTGCEVKGIQGGVSPDEGIDCTIYSGKYYTVNTPGKVDSFYAAYVTGGATLRINGGEFSAESNRFGSIVEGTSAVACGDNDTNRPLGYIVINGGKFSGKPYNNITKQLYEPSNGKGWLAIEGDGVYKWTVVK